MRRQHFSAGDLIFSQGDPSAYAYVVDAGVVEIFREEDGQTWVLGTIGPGEIFGEMGLVDERPRSASARVVEDAHVSAVTGDEFVQLLFDNSDDGLRYLKALFERLRTMNDMAGGTALRPSQLKRSTSAPGAEPVPGPKVRIFPLTSRTARDIPDTGRLVDTWPFRVGRAAAGILGDNHLEIKDQQPYSMSRNHFLIDWSGDTVLVRDRGSFLGTVINGEKIGGKRSRGEVILKPGDNTVIAGDRGSSFRFRIRVGEE